MDLRSTLKTQTAEKHQKLDDFIGELNVFSTPEKYRLYLSGMHAIYQIFGEAADAAAVLAGLEPNSKILTTAIINDAGSLSFSNQRSPKSIECESSIWAVGYVMEGSAMGARYMVKAAQSLVQDAPEASIGCEYLQALSNESYQRWPKFIDALNQSSCDVSSAVLAADEVFEIANQIFQQLAAAFESAEVA